jgi:hypothetical protein
LGWLNQYQKGRIEIYHDVSGFDKPLAEVNHLVRLMIMGVLLAGMIVGSAIATGIGIAFGTEETEVFTTIAFYGYIAAMFLSGLIILSGLWNYWRSKRKPY